MKHLGDITKIHGDKIEPVDCITFGSPCQGLSMAGKRLGFDDNRSVLFLDAARIIKEMRTATNGMYPTFAVWENVPGAFSSNGGEDFRAVLEELARVEQPNASIPRPSGRGGRWSKAGAIAGNGWSLAWRQLDAQYWGVPQRRKRIALVADFRGQRATEILFERTGVPGNLDESIKAWEEAPGAAGSRIAGNDRPVPILNDQGGGVMGVSYNVTGTLRAAEHGHQPIVFESNAQPVVLESNQAHATATQTGICPTLSASMGMGGGYIPMVTERKIFDARGNGDGRTCPTITGDHENRITDYTAIAIERKTFNEQLFSSYKESNKCSTLKAKAGNIGNGSECLIAEKTIRWIVRRLTPVECERLQGYPDRYTDIGDWTDSKGKKHKYADSPRYKALGNSIALPQWFWLVQRMRPYLKEKPTLGSLFDGLGGFPLVWQRAYGEGTARWASEIEEFPMAVTKRRFGEE
jgi:DNA (cytosine-5)-methyltransferase 1|nr:MAG TPA: Cytosine specific methyltransferase [Caudoviricetes sp.]